MTGGAPRRLFTVAFPRFAGAGQAFVEDHRARRAAAQAARLPAHFTLVFGCAGIAESDYLDHVRQVAEASPAIDFHCCYAMLGADDEDGSAYVFLVPDEGHAALSLLHDRLYSGLLAARLRLDLPYTPHITIGHTADRHQAKAWCEELNAVGVDVRGRVDALTVGTLVDGRFLALASCGLQRPT